MTAPNPNPFPLDHLAVRGAAEAEALVVGDARLTFAREPSGTYDVIIVDAYSSDAIPIHLATEEAMEIYKDKLAPHGAVVMHISNRHLELESVVVGIADANDLKSWVYSEDTWRDAEYIFSTTVVVSARSPDRDPRATPGAVELDREEIRRNPGSASDVFRALDMLPGVVATGEFSSFTVRGNGPRDNLILVDGIPFEQVVHFDQGVGEEEDVAIEPQGIRRRRLGNGQGPAGGVGQSAHDGRRAASSRASQGRRPGPAGSSGLSS